LMLSSHLSHGLLAGLLPYSFPIQYIFRCSSNIHPDYTTSSLQYLVLNTFHCIRSLSQLRAIHCTLVSFLSYHWRHRPHQFISQTLIIVVAFKTTQLSRFITNFLVPLTHCKYH
jgi:hypothetical protein